MRAGHSYLSATLASVALSLSSAGVPSARAAPAGAEIAGADEAERRGAQMFAYDQAAWHATDRLLADLAANGIGLDRLRGTQGGGYIVEPGDGGRLIVTFYAVDDGRRRARARYTVADRVVTGGGLVQAEDEQLSLLAARMIDARDRALALASERKLTLCSDSSPNTLVLPPSSAGIVSVYVLTSTKDDGVYPLGGHYRFDFDDHLQLIGFRKFLNTCLAVDWRGRTPTPTAFYLTHLLDPQPTEAHVFVSLNVPMPLMVGTTANKEVWSVDHGRITYVERPARK